MKFTKRAVLRALITATAAAAAVLPLTSPAFAAPTPPSANPALFGTWANTNPATRSMVDIVISPASSGGLMADGFGACAPTACEWGNIPGTVFGPNVSAATGSTFEANWDFGFARTVLLATLTQPGGTATLVVNEYTTFTDGSGRANYTLTEKFVPASNPITPTRTGTPATDYPTGDWVPPKNGLLGTWNTTTPNGGLAQIVLAKNPDGTLSVHAFGACSPLCDWGTVTGITFGANISSTSSRQFLAPYTFSFKKALLSAWLNTKGTTLYVQTYSEFNAGDGRSNYVIPDTFARA